jgi:hypothetical protein
VWLRSENYCVHAQYDVRMLSVEWNNSSEIWEDIQQAVNGEIKQWGSSVLMFHHNIPPLYGMNGQKVPRLGYQAKELWVRNQSWTLIPFFFL